MKINDYAYVLKFEEFTSQILKYCVKKLGEPDKLVIDTNIYLFVYEKSGFRLCVDSSESYCYPNDPDIFIRFIYTSYDNLLVLDELPSVSIRKCNSILRKCKKRIGKAARDIFWPPMSKEWRNIIVALGIVSILCIVGYSYRLYQWVEKIWKH